MTPDGAVAVATLGLCLVFLELNRPGRILPGAAGLLLTLLGMATLLRDGVEPPAALLLFCSCGVFLLNLWRRLPVWLLLSAIVLVIGSLRYLLPLDRPAAIRLPVAVACGSLLGLLSAWLTRVAYRARRAKALD